MKQINTGIILYISNKPYLHSISGVKPSGMEEFIILMFEVGDNMSFTHPHHF